MGLVLLLRWHLRKQDAKKKRRKRLQNHLDFQARGTSRRSAVVTFPEWERKRQELEAKPQGAELSCRHAAGLGAQRWLWEQPGPAAPVCPAAAPAAALSSSSANKDHPGRAFLGISTACQPFLVENEAFQAYKNWWKINVLLQNSAASEPLLQEAEAGLVKKILKKINQLCYIKIHNS